MTDNFQGLFVLITMGYSRIDAKDYTKWNFYGQQLYKFIKIFPLNFHLVVDGVVIYPREPRCSRVGGMCVEKDKCRSLVSASGLCPNSQSKGVECCFECKSLRK